MIQFRNCAIEHVRYIEAQDAQKFEYDASMSEDIVAKSAALSAWEGWRCIAAAGVFTVWPGRAVAWAVLSKHAARHLLPITRRCLYMLDHYNAKRIEMTCRSDFPEAHRWAILMGFTQETPNGMECFYPDGSTAYLYSRTK